MKIRFLIGTAALAMSLGTAQPASSQANSAPSQDELLFWETIKGSSNPADFQEYLKQYPNGRFAGLARIRLRNAPAAASTPAQNAIAKTAASPETRGAGFPLPQKGDAWTYRYLDRKYGRKQEQFSVRVDDVAEHAVTEMVAVGGVPGDARRIDLQKLNFSSRALLGGRTLIEFAPYLASMETTPQLPYRIRSGSGYPIGNAASGGDWQVILATLPSTVVTVPAGKFEVKCFDLKGSRRATYGLERFQLTAWYAPEAKRYVRLEHRRWNRDSTLTADDLVELAEFAKH